MLPLLGGHRQACATGGVPQQLQVCKPQQHQTWDLQLLEHGALLQLPQLLAEVVRHAPCCLLWLHSCLQRWVLPAMVAQLLSLQPD
jgi:hypothetical protein